ncbi:helix-turn-helix transcriptional regulator [Herbiconiux sp. SYSU D00978]|uniref:helix-turn-helix transcriptional regulator n=1 Tax=Herbiconiux sp. SYSU D00978 TaxID=2812562 RepID=UPI001A95BF22|nr:WYL domain-containing protein [Herbiconiux sp. SYSU D00978]
MPEKTPQPGARDKLAFLLALTPYLLDHEHVTVRETARHFGVPESQVREAVRLIAVSGVPGETSFYQHEDLFDIDWDAFEEHDEIAVTNRVAIDEAPRFSGKEAAALIAGLQYLSSLPEIADRAAVGSLLAKLQRGSSAQPSPVAVQSQDPDATLALLRRAAAEGRRVEFDYVGGRGQLEHRSVDPLRVESADATWYLRGWDHSREAVRTFRLDRIGEARLSEEASTHRAAEVALPETLFTATDDDLFVTIDVDPSALPLLADYLPEGTTTEGENGRRRATVRVSHHAGLKRLIASMPGLATVVSPAEARDAVAEWARAGLDRYREAGE